MAVFWVAAPYNLIEVYQLSKVRANSINFVFSAAITLNAAEVIVGRQLGQSCLNLRCGQ
jgi:hypothetical protein